MTGAVGYLPSTYLARLLPGERVHRVSQFCQLAGSRGKLVSLTRDQVGYVKVCYGSNPLHFIDCDRNAKRMPGAAELR